MNSLTTMCRKWAIVPCLIFALISLFALSSCGGGSNAAGPGSLASSPVAIEGVNGYVQKGPFVQGSTVEIQELDSNFEATGDFFSTTISNHMGTFAITNNNIDSGYIEIIGSGYYFNEVSGALSDSTLTLRTWANLTETRAESDINANILTTLARSRISELLTSGVQTSFSGAQTAAEEEVLEMFHILPADISGGSIANFDTMDIAATGDNNAVLLATSAVLQGSNTVAELSELIAQIEDDITADGDLTTQTLKDELKNNAMGLSLSTIRANLVARYTALGATTAVVPEFEDFIDSNGDGTINRNDTTAPAITSTGRSPASGATGVSLSDPIQITFDEKLDSNTVNTTNITVSAGGTEIDGTVSLDSTGKIVTFTPTASLTSFTTYTISVSNISDVAACGTACTRWQTYHGKTTTDATLARVENVMADTEWLFTTVLAAPANVSATASGSGEVTVSWDAVTGAAGYTVYYGTSAGVTTEDSHSGNITSTSTEISSLTNGTTYYFAVVATSTGTTSDLSSEVSATPYTNWAIAAGQRHSLALKPDGTVWAWGTNTNGQLGDGTTTQRNAPVQVCLTYSGGSCTQYLSAITSIAAAGSYSLARKSDGTVWAWGDNTWGQLGNGTNDQKLVATQVTGITTATTVAAGTSHSIAVVTGGALVAWGANDSGQLGNNSTTTSTTPVSVNTLTNVTGISAGGTHSLAVDSSGNVYAWGSNSQGQLGDGTNDQRLVPTQVATISGGSVIVAGESHSIVLKTDGSILAWGYNFNGQLGDNSTTARNSPVAVSSLTANTTTAIGAGWSHSLAVKTNGTIVAWGSNINGQLGNNSNDQSNIPVAVSIFTSGVSVVTGGGYHSLAIKSDGTVDETVWAWGSGEQGQLGDGLASNSLVPVQVTGL